MGDLQTAHGYSARERHASVDLRCPQWRTAVSALSALAVGPIATFISINGSGSAALLVGCATSPVSVLLADRLASLKISTVELHLRGAARQIARQAAYLEVHSGPEAAERLGEEAERLRRGGSIWAVGTIAQSGSN
jgi:hypothetical protein